MAETSVAIDEPVLDVCLIRHTRDHIIIQPPLQPVEVETPTTATRFVTVDNHDDFPMPPEVCNDTHSF